MELARNPSDKNISNWIEFNKKKNALNQRLQLRMREYLTQTKQLNPKVAEVIKTRSINLSSDFEPSRYRIRMYFDSKCPHCKRMFQTLVSLQDQGIYVEALQVDDLNVKASTFPIPTRRASKSEVKKHKISAVPFTLIADLKKKVLYPPIKGFQSVESMTALIKEGEKF